MNLSPHFTLAEATASAKARELGLDNTPPPHVVPALQMVALWVLEPIRAHFGKPIVYDGALSWYRSPDVNKAVGGAASSQHVKGEAVDIEIAGVSNVDIARWVRDNIIFDLLILENFDGATPSSGWVHVSRVAAGNRGQAGTYYKGRYDWTKLP